MQNSSGNLRAQVQHSTMVLNGFMGDVQLLKSESKALTKSINTVAKDYLKQCKRHGVAPEYADSRLAQLFALKNCSQSVYAQSDNLKFCLDAVVNKSYKRDLKRVEQGKPTKVFTGGRQEAETFETHIRLVESLVATVLPHSEASNCHSALLRDFGRWGNLDNAHSALNDSAGVGDVTPVLGEFRVRSMKAAAVRLRDQLEAPHVRERVRPMRPNGESSNSIS